jgi:hypothetical protein
LGILSAPPALPRPLGHYDPRLTVHRAWNSRNAYLMPAYGMLGVSDSNGVGVLSFGTQGYLRSLSAAPLARSVSHHAATQ